MSTNGVVIAGITLDLDPEDYVIIGGKRRGSIHPLIDGTTVFQDRGFQPTDQRITLTGKLYKLATLQGLYALYKGTSAPMDFQDYKGNHFLVIFTPGTESFVAKPMHGSNIGYTYTMSLCVTSVLSSLGQ